MALVTMRKITKGKFNGATLYERRVLLGLKLEDVAERVKRSVSTVWGWENGVNQPRANIVRALGEALGVGPEFFFQVNRK